MRGARYRRRCGVRWQASRERRDARSVRRRVEMTAVRRTRRIRAAGERDVLHAWHAMPSCCAMLDKPPPIYGAAAIDRCLISPIYG